MVLWDIFSSLWKSDVIGKTRKKNPQIVLCLEPQGRQFTISEQWGGRHLTRHVTQRIYDIK